MTTWTMPDLSDFEQAQLIDELRNTVGYSANEAGWGMLPCDPDDEVAIMEGSLPIEDGELVSKTVSGTVDQVMVADEDKRLVFGWASVLSKGDGTLVIDRQGDYIDDEWEMESAAYQYVIDCRVGGYEHVQKGVATVVESMVFTSEKIAAMGLPDTFPRGWWLGMRVLDDATWELAKSGKFTGFSVHGRGTRTATEHESPIISITTYDFSKLGKGNR